MKVEPLSLAPTIGPRRTDVSSLTLRPSVCLRHELTSRMMRELFSWYILIFMTRRIFVSATLLLFGVLASGFIYSSIRPAESANIRSQISQTPDSATTDMQPSSASTTTAPIAHGTKDFQTTMWLFSYPSDLILTTSSPKLPVKIVQLQGEPLNGAEIIVNYLPLSDRAERDTLQELVTTGKSLDILRAVITLQKEGVDLGQGSDGLKFISSSTIFFGNKEAVQFVTQDKTGYFLKTTFLKGDNLVDVSLLFASTLGPTSSAIQLYDSMLQSFKFK